MKQKVVITGANGQLGRELHATVPPDVDAYWLRRTQLDIGDSAAVQAALVDLKPQLVINAAAYTAVDRAESEPEMAMRVNALGPAHLAAACLGIGARLIHVSTDFVFDGRASSPYGTAAATAPLGIYGQSKLAGEQAAMTELDSVLILRTGWVYSRYGGNFVKTMLKLMAERDELTVVSDQVGTPTWARGLAETIWSAAERPELSGHYHWSDAGVCSWYDFAVAIAEEALALDLLRRPVAVQPIATDDYPTPAQRPAYSVLDKSTSWRDLALPAIHWRVQLRTMLRQLRDSMDA